MFRKGFFKKKPNHSLGALIQKFGFRVRAYRIPQMDFKAGHYVVEYALKGTSFGALHFPTKTRVIIVACGYECQHISILLPMLISHELVQYSQKQAPPQALNNKAPKILGIIVGISLSGGGELAY